MPKSAFGDKLSLGPREDLVFAPASILLPGPSPDFEGLDLSVLQEKGAAQVVIGTRNEPLAPAGPPAPGLVKGVFISWAL